MKLFLSPHCDDETLFGAFTIIRDSPDVIVVFGDDQVRMAETRSAFEALGRIENSFADDTTNLAFLRFHEQIPPRAIEEEIKSAIMLSVRGVIDHVYAPAIEENGHPHHNFVGRLANELFPGKVTHYLTYTRAGKSTTGVPVPFEPEWVERKLRALACYSSQIRQANQVEHFLRDQREYYQQ